MAQMKMHLRWEIRSEDGSLRMAGKSDSGLFDPPLPVGSDEEALFWLEPERPPQRVWFSSVEPTTWA